MDLDDEMRHLMAEQAAQAGDRPMFSAETGDDGRKVHVIRIGSDLLGMLIMYVCGLWLGMLLARRGD